MDLRDWSKNTLAVFLVSATIVAWLTLYVVAGQPSPSDHTSSLDVFNQIVPKPGKPVHHLEQLYPTWWGKPPNIFFSHMCPDPGSCVECHRDHTNMDEAHAISCIRCHKGDNTAEEKQQAHKGLIPGPGDLTHVHETCGTCHPDERPKGASLTSWKFS